MSLKLLLKEVLSPVANGVCSSLSPTWLLSFSGLLLITRTHTNYSLCCSIPTQAVNMKTTRNTLYGLETDGLSTLESSSNTNRLMSSTKLEEDQPVPSVLLTKLCVLLTLKDLIWLVAKDKPVIAAWVDVLAKLPQI